MYYCLFNSLKEAFVPLLPDFQLPVAQVPHEANDLRVLEDLLDLRVVVDDLLDFLCLRVQRLVFPGVRGIASVHDLHELGEDFHEL